jgi:hypothetical protein
LEVRLGVKSLGVGKTGLSSLQRGYLTAYIWEENSDEWETKSNRRLKMNKSLTPLLAALSLVPIILNIIAVFFLLPDTVALHFGLDGVVDRYGSKFETFVLGGLCTGFNLLLTFIFYKAEKAMQLGLVHGTNVRGSRICLFIGIIVLDLVSILPLVLLLQT